LCDDGGYRIRPCGQATTIERVLEVLHRAGVEITADGVRLIKGR
jgi:hypothetical protein